MTIIEERRQTGKIIVDLILIGVLIIAIVDIQSFPEQASFMPRFIAWVTILFLAISIVTEAFPVTRQFLTPATPRSDDRSTEQAELPADWASVFKVMGYTLVFWTLVLFFGFYIVPPVLVTLYLIFEGRVHPGIAIVCALVATGLTIFGMGVLGVSPWIGAGPEFIEDYVGGAVMPLF